MIPQRGVVAGVVASVLLLPVAVQAASVELVSAFRRVTASASAGHPQSDGPRDTDSDEVDHLSEDPGGSAFEPWSAVASAAASVLPPGAAEPVSQVLSVSQVSDIKPNVITSRGVLRNADTAGDREGPGRGSSTLTVKFRLDSPHVFDFTSAGDDLPQPGVDAALMVFQTDAADQVINLIDLKTADELSTDGRTLAAGLWELRLLPGLTPAAGQGIDFNYDYAFTLTPSGTTAVPLPPAAWSALATMGLWSAGRVATRVWSKRS